MGAPIVTTNYDDLLEQSLGLASVDWCDPPAMQQALVGTDRAVVHLHGYWRRPSRWFCACVHTRYCWALCVHRRCSGR